MKINTLRHHLALQRKPNEAMQRTRDKSGPDGKFKVASR
jgi:hypothetical protein